MRATPWWSCCRVISWPFLSFPLCFSVSSSLPHHPATIQSNETLICVLYNSAWHKKKYIITMTITNVTFWLKTFFVLVLCRLSLVICLTKSQQTWITVCHPWRYYWSLKMQKCNSGGLSYLKKKKNHQSEKFYLNYYSNYSYSIFVIHMYTCGRWSPSPMNMFVPYHSNGKCDYFLIMYNSSYNSYRPIGIPPLGNLGCLLWGKASCDKVALPNHAGCFIVSIIHHSDKCHGLQDL